VRIVVERIWYKFSYEFLFGNKLFVKCLFIFNAFVDLLMLCLFLPCGFDLQAIGTASSGNRARTTTLGRKEVRLLISGKNNCCLAMNNSGYSSNWKLL
jgi:hypothetical protein